VVAIVFAVLVLPRVQNGWVITLSSVNLLEAFLKRLAELRVKGTESKYMHLTTAHRDSEK